MLLRKDRAHAYNRCLRAPFAQDSLPRIEQQRLGVVLLRRKPLLKEEQPALQKLALLAVLRALPLYIQRALSVRGLAHAVCVFFTHTHDRVRVRVVRLHHPGPAGALEGSPSVSIASLSRLCVHDRVLSFDARRYEQAKKEKREKKTVGPRGWGTRPGRMQHARRDTAAAMTLRKKHHDQAAAPSPRG